MKEHNLNRAKHDDTPNLTWDDTLASGAQQWANRLANMGRLQHSSSRSYGENLYMAGGWGTPATCKSATSSWWVAFSRHPRAMLLAMSYPTLHPSSEVTDILLLWYPTENVAIAWIWRSIIFLCKITGTTCLLVFSTGDNKFLYFNSILEERYRLHKHIKLWLFKNVAYIHFGMI